MPQIKIPDRLKLFFKKEGIDDLPRILEFLTHVNPAIIINNNNYPVLTFLAGKIISNFETLGAVSTKRFTVPPGKRWRVLGLMSIEVDVDHTINIKLHDDKDKILGQIAQIAAPGVGNYYYPYDIAATAGSLEFWKMLKGLYLPAGWYLEITWGATQTTPEVSFPVMEIDVE